MLGYKVSHTKYKSWVAKDGISTYNPLIKQIELYIIGDNILFLSLSSKKETETKEELIKKSINKELLECAKQMYYEIENNKGYGFDDYKKDKAGIPELEYCELKSQRINGIKTVVHTGLGYFD